MAKGKNKTGKQQKRVIYLKKFAQPVVSPSIGVKNGKKIGKMLNIALGNVQKAKANFKQLV